MIPIRKIPSHRTSYVGDFKLNTVQIFKGTVTKQSLSPWPFFFECTSFSSTVTSKNPLEFGVDSDANERVPSAKTSLNSLYFKSIKSEDSLQQSRQFFEFNVAGSLTPINLICLPTLL